MTCSRFAAAVWLLTLLLGVHWPWIEAHAGGLGADQRRALETSRLASDKILAAFESTGRAEVLIVFAVRGRTGFLSDPSARAEIAAAGDAILAAFDPGEFRLRHRFDAKNILAGSIDPAGLLRLSGMDTVVAVEAELGGSGRLIEALPLAALDAVQARGLTGSGVTVAVLDTGIDTDHADLSDDLVEERCFCSGGGGCCHNGSTPAVGHFQADSVEFHQGADPTDRFRNHPSGKDPYANR